jgi:aldehyde dehydrogenase (NAD+)
MNPVSTESGRTTQTGQKYLNFIGGEWSAARSGEFFENRNPAHKGEVIGLFPKSTKADVEAAVAAARSAFDEWRLTPAPVRGEILKRCGDLLVERKEKIARDMTREMGKVLAETRGDVQEGIDTAYYAQGEGRRLFGQTVPSELPNKFAMTVRNPLGVAGIITPWNFPLAIPTWKIFPALLAGNTVVFKPASDVPLSAHHFVEALIDAGVPRKAVNLVHGGGGEVGTAIVEHPHVPVVSFTGSSYVGRMLGESCGRTLKRLSLELGGKNAQIVMDDADLDLALEGALWGAFGTTGQRCTATSRLILHERIHDKFVERLVERARALVLGDGLDAKSQVGPLVNAKQVETIHGYVEIGKNEGAELACGGKPATAGALADGYFYEPTVFTGVTPAMRIAREEIFGPVLSVLRIRDLDEAVRVLNDTEYGLSSSIYTRDVNAAFRAMRDIQAGITYINGPTIGAEAHLPFGGVKDTGNGHREGGWTAYEIFTETKTIYVDYSGRLQRAQIDNRPS